MIPIKQISKSIIPAAALVFFSGCTKLDEKLGSTFTGDQVVGALGTGALLQAAYADLAGPFTAQDLLFCLEENTTDEALVPTRGGDWDDNGVWRVLHNHSWNADHQYVLNVFNALNKISYDATNVLNYQPTEVQAAEARFLRAVSLYYQLDLYGQYPLREPGSNLLDAPEVKSGAAAVQFIIDEVEEILPKLPTGNGSNKANPDAAKFLLMKCYLQRGAFLNREAPTFDAADMNKVISLGNEIMTGGKYNFTPDYFENFSPNNGANSTEAIFRYENNAGAAANNSGAHARWNMTLHYNSYTPANPNAGWNGFSTLSDFYNSFGAVTATSNANRVGGFFTGVGSNNNPDVTIDSRLGGRNSSANDNYSISKSGIRPGFLIGQQYNEAGTALKDRKGNPLAYDPKIADNQIETGANLEITGIRVIKYTPDYANYGSNPGNDIMLFRYADVVLMVAEAKMRTGDDAGGLELVNDLRVARKAAPFASIVLANPANLEDPNTLLAERGRELYWESVRRTDMIRFGMYLKTWTQKPTDDKKYLVYPIPNQALAANPNLVQNPGY